MSILDCGVNSSKHGDSELVVGAVIRQGTRIVEGGAHARGDIYYVENKLVTTRTVARGWRANNGREPSEVHAGCWA